MEDSTRNFLKCSSKLRDAIGAAELRLLWLNGCPVNEISSIGYDFAWRLSQLTEELWARAFGCSKASAMDALFHDLGIQFQQEDIRDDDVRHDSPFDIDYDDEEGELSFSGWSSFRLEFDDGVSGDFRKLFDVREDEGYLTLDWPITYHVLQQKEERVTAIRIGVAISPLDGDDYGYNYENYDEEDFPYILGHLVDIGYLVDIGQTVLGGGGYVES